MKANVGKTRPTSAPPDRTSLKRLTDHIPADHPRRAEAFQALVAAADKAFVSDRPPYIIAAVKYSGKDDVPELMARVQKHISYSNVTDAILARFVEMQDPAAIAAMAEWIGARDTHLKLESQKALRKLGPVAEKAVREYTSPKTPAGKTIDFDHRLIALAVLADIGTADSLPHLQGLLNDPAPTIKADAKRTIAAIQKRGK